MNPNDPRVKRTKQLIRQAFAELLQKKGFDAVTVNDVAAAATINRATFYAHYADKYALLDEITALAFGQMLPETVAAADAFTEEICRQLVAVVHAYILTFYQKCRLDTQAFAVQIDEKVKQALCQTVEEILLREGNPHAAVHAAMVSAAIYSAALRWFRENPQGGTQELCAVVVPFVLGGLGDG